MNWIFINFVLSVIFVPIFTEEYHCVWGGVCTSVMGNSPCAKNGSAVSLEGYKSDTKAKLKKRCPHFFENGDGM